jgi:hypothetical protein
VATAVATTTDGPAHRNPNGTIPFSATRVRRRRASAAEKGGSEIWNAARGALDRDKKAGASITKWRNEKSSGIGARGAGARLRSSF